MTLLRAGARISPERCLIGLFLLLVASVIGTRDLSTGTDTLNYANNFLSLQTCACIEPTFEPGFQALTLAVGALGVGTSFYFSAISLLLFCLGSLVARKGASVFGYPRPEVIRVQCLVFCFLFLSPFFVSVHINAIRQGIASFIVFYSFFCLLQKNWAAFALSSVGAALIHYSAAMYVALFPLMLLPLAALLPLTLLLSLAYALGLTEHAVLWISNITGTGLYEFIAYYAEDADYKRGIRHEFLFFSWAAVVLVLVAYFIVAAPRRHAVLAVLKIYLILIIPFLLFGFANYSNRYAFTAWLFLSVMLGVLANALRTGIRPSIRVLSLFLVPTGAVFAFMARHSLLA